MGLAIAVFDIYMRGNNIQAPNPNAKIANLGNDQNQRILFERERAAAYSWIFFLKTLASILDIDDDDDSVKGPRPYPVLAREF